MPTRVSTKKTAKPAAPALQLAVQYALAADAEQAAADLPTRAQIRRWIKAAIPELAENSAEITVRLVDSAEGSSLNRDYRGKNQPTNVLSFSYTQHPLSGDIVLCVPVVMQEASQQGKSLIAHYAHLIVHGMLHLQGWDHQNDAEASAMEARETEIVLALGYDHPYQRAV